MEITTARYINVNGSLLDLSQPRVMGILNVTPDSFYAGSRTQTEVEIARRVKQIVSEGAAIIDIGAYSSRPNADNVSAREEMERLRMGLKILFEIQPDAVVSVDTFRADVARMCVEEYGVAIINDIAAGEMDANMFHSVAAFSAFPAAVLAFDVAVRVSVISPSSVVCIWEKLVSLWNSASALSLSAEVRLLSADSRFASSAVNVTPRTFISVTALFAFSAA